MRKFIVFLTLMVLAGFSQAFDFDGYTLDTEGQALNATNVTIEMYFMVPHQGPVLNATYSTLSNASGYFKISSLPDSAQAMFKPILTHYSGADADYVGKSLPELPYLMIQNLSNISFYLWEAATINLTIYGTNRTGQSVDKTFEYQIKDTRLGYPVKYQFGSQVAQVTVYLPANRNYSIMVYADEAFPFTYELNNLSAYSAPRHIDLRLNATDSYKWVSGYAALNGGAGFDSLDIVGYIVEPGSMIFNWPIPANMSSWRDGVSSDTFNPTTGFYNMTLLASSQTSNVLLFVVAKNGSSYYGAFKNITLAGNSSEALNFSLVELLGGYIGNITIQGQQDKIVQTKMVRFLLMNASGTALTQAFINAQVNYSSLGQAAFMWAEDISSTDNGIAAFPMLSSDVSLEAFTSDGAPKKTTIPAANLTQDPVNVRISAFNPGGIDEVISGIFIDFLVSNETCDVPEPPAGCSLMPQTDMSSFNPFSIVMGGGSMSFRMGKLTSGNSTGIIVHYVNVDLLASGPPDALFDANANSSSNSSTFSEAWRFGSSGPSIYDRIIIGMPYSDNLLNDSGNISVLLKKLYDENWNVVWDADVNSSIQVPPDYGDFNGSWFNSSTHGPVCTSNLADLCYINTSTNMLWIQLPHFSGTGPDVLGEAPDVVIQTNSETMVTGWNLISLPLNI